MALLLTLFVVVFSYEELIQVTHNIYIYTKPTFTGNTFSTRNSNKSQLHYHASCVQTRSVWTPSYSLQFVPISAVSVRVDVCQLNAVWIILYSAHVRRARATDITYPNARSFVPGVLLHGLLSYLAYTLLVICDDLFSLERIMKN